MLFKRLNVFLKRVSSIKYRTISTSRLRVMQEDYVVINSVPTHIYTYGQWIEDKFDDKTKELILIICGNPGLPGFYTTFGSTLYNELNKQVPVWVIGHAGHDEPKKGKKMTTPPLKGNERLYNLQGQMEHKIEFIERFLPKDVKVYLIGHSIGSWMSLNLLNFPQFSRQVQHAYLMFPTIERIADSEKGRRVPTWDRFFFMLRFFYSTLDLLPSSWKRSLVSWQCRRDGMPEEFIDQCLEYTNPPVIDKIWFLALDEMKKVREIDEETLKTNMNRLKLYYGTIDDWVRTEYFHELVDRFPGIDAELCTQKYEHAFVIKTSREVGKMVTEWINLKRLMKT